MDEPAPVEIRILKSGDEPILLKVADDVFDEPIDLQRLTAYLAEPNHILMVAIENDTVIAQVALVIHRHPDRTAELYIDNVGVSPVWQRRGVARMMLEKAFEVGRSRGCGQAWVGTEPDNMPAIGLYRQRGAEPVPVVMFEYDLEA